MTSQEKLKDLVIYCPLTGIMINRVYAGARSPAGAIRGGLTDAGYLATTVGKKHYRIHVLAWLYMTGDWPKNQIDHINGIRSDNRWCNLRDVTVRENRQNQTCHRAGKFPGVQQVSKGSYRVSARVDGERIYLKNCKTQEEGYKVYCDFLDSIGEKHL